MSLKSKLSLSAMIATAVVLFPAMAMAQDAASNQFDTNSMLATAAGFAVGLAALGGTLGQGRAAAAALEGISRNPGAAARIQTPMILGLALIESLVLLAWVIAFMLQGQIK
ncbi:ATP synthase F0 subunit C [Chondromyces apiculatus]|uniref:ATP synthase subunit c n=1 Tax=Chondromyces apiculatus DSM 436 TaxID=1192034 RepID=A0A017TCW9_9BACT|nr:ATP synthase F0 subunit C [Chondromyces apiculatus]EYF06660.1 ATP synthase C chain [Chondromyces apiculatus DSM 436]